MPFNEGRAFIHAVDFIWELNENGVCILYSLCIGDAKNDKPALFLVVVYLFAALYVCFLPAVHLSYMCECATLT